MRDRPSRDRERYFSSGSLSQTGDAQFLEGKKERKFFSGFRESHPMYDRLEYQRLSQQNSGRGERLMMTKVTERRTLGSGTKFRRGKTDSAARLSIQ